MKSLTIFTICACLAVVTLPAWGQAASANTANGVHGIAGYLDPQTGTFKPVRAKASSAEPASQPPTQGTFVVGLTVNLITNFPSGETFVCSANAEAFDVSSGLDFLESDVVAATRSGNTLTCTMMIPYYWQLADPSGDTVAVGFSVQATGPSSSNGLPSRSTTQGIVASYPIPPQFKTTTFNLGAVL